MGINIKKRKRQPLNETPERIPKTHMIPRYAKEILMPHTDRHHCTWTRRCLSAAYYAGVSFFKLRYVVQQIPMVDPNGCNHASAPRIPELTPQITHNLQRQWHQPKINQLHRRPQHIIRLQRPPKHGLQFPRHRLPPAHLTHRHKRKKPRQTCPPYQHPSQQPAPWLSDSPIGENTT